ncbi:MAG: hypothetical protein EHM28_06430 [Spirochaetaceae bacterium]|nr:MAG: hypothetical protein EHM28_06430 [Spirochaetaceae bacterium]
MNIVNLIIQAVGGAIGGNVTGKIIPRIDQGVVINSIAGIVGGGLGGQLLNMLGIAAMPSGSFDIVSILGNIASGAVGGGILMAIVGFIIKLFKK